MQFPPTNIRQSLLFKAGAVIAALLLQSSSLLAAGPELRFENMVKIPRSEVSFPSDDLLVFHHNARGSKTATRWHNHNTLRIHSTGTEALVI